MNRKKNITGFVLAVSLLWIVCWFAPVSADDNIIVKPMPSEYSQNDYIRILIKTTYPTGSFLNYNFTLETQYPHRGKISGHAGSGSGTRVDENHRVLSDKILLQDYIPGDWILRVWEDDNLDKAYLQRIHIYPAGEGPGEVPEITVPDNCPGVVGFGFNPVILPDTSETGDVFAKGQALYLSGGAPPGSSVGVWIYGPAGEGSVTPAFVRLFAGCDGKILGDGEILSVFDSYKSPAGRYTIYAANGDDDLIAEGYIPSTSGELEGDLGDAGLQYSKFVVDLAEPSIGFDEIETRDNEKGSTLKMHGETNLKSGTLLDVIIIPTTVDESLFNGKITKQTTVENNGGSNRWSYILDTALLGPGEYRVTVESPEGLGDANAVFNVYDTMYGPAEPAEGILSITSYGVEDDAAEPDAGHVVSGPRQSSSVVVGSSGPSGSGPGTQASPWNAGIILLETGLMAAAIIFATGRDEI